MKTTRLITLILATALLARADVLPPSQDTSSLKSKLTPLAGKATTLAVSATRKGYVLFNLNSLPVDVLPADIVNARLRVYLSATKKPGDISVCTATAAWSETAATAAEPSIAANAIAMFPAATVVAKKFVEVDVTSTVQAWRTTPATNFGFAFVASGLTDVLIGSKEGSGSGYPCELDIEIQRTIADGSITAAQLADGSVTTAKLGSSLTLGGTTTGTFSGDFSGNGSGLTGVVATTVSRSPQQIALLKWGVSSVNNTFAVGASPYGICFDGASIWVANARGGSVTKLNASTGAVQGTFAVGAGPYAICFDRASIWVANQGSNNVTKLNASTGDVQGTFPVGAGPQGICFDGANIWVANQGSNNVMKF